MPIWGWSDLDSMASGKPPIIGGISPQITDGYRGRGAQYPSEPEEIWALGDISETLLGGTRTNRIIGNRVEVLLDWNGILLDQLLTRPFLSQERARTSTGWGGKTGSFFIDNLLTWLGGLGADSTFRFSVQNEHQYFGSKVYYSRRMGKVYVPPEFTVRNIRKLNKVAFAFTGLLFCLSVARVILLRLNHSRDPETESNERKGNTVTLITGILGFVCDNLLLGLISWLDRNSALYEGLKNQVDYLEKKSAHLVGIEANHKSSKIDSEAPIVDADPVLDESISIPRGRLENEQEEVLKLKKINRLGVQLISTRFKPQSPMTLLEELKRIHLAKSSRARNEWEQVKKDVAIDAYDLKNLFALKPKKAEDGINADNPMR